MATIGLKSQAYGISLLLFHLQFASLKCQGQYEHCHGSNKTNRNGHLLNCYCTKLHTPKLSTLWSAEPSSILVIKEPFTA